MAHVDYTLGRRRPAAAQRPPMRPATLAAKEPPPDPATVFLTTAELAARLRRSAISLRKWRSRKCGPPFLRPGGPGSPVLYRISDIDAWERAQTVETSGGGDDGNVS
jgi:hypothetical protein